MISSYLERPLRTLEQALDDRAQRAVLRTGSDLTGPGSVELLVRVLTEKTNHYGALEVPTPTLAPAYTTARQRSPLDRRRAA